ncbi:MAG: hypothetical protein KDB29_04875 [Planctomycetes bacterium]|nr:hypothetical protein [Planctomycetota bacterium]
MAIGFSATARRLGIASAITVAVLLAGYATSLTIGLLALPNPNEPIKDPMFSILEVTIILLMPAMVAMMVAVHAWTPARRKPLSMVALLFMCMVAIVTCCLHFIILTVGNHPDIKEQDWAPFFFSFRWPSIAYALDIIAWDLFFPLSMLFAAPVFSGSRLGNAIRFTMIASGVLALAGLIGVITGNMQLRNIGIIGYVPVFLCVAVLIALLFARTDTVANDPNS